MTKDERRKYNEIYREKNRKRLREYHAKWRERNREALNRQKREYWKRAPESVKLSYLKYKEKHPEEYKKSQRKRKYKYYHSLSDKELRKLIDYGIEYEGFNRGNDYNAFVPYTKEEDMIIMTATYKGNKISAKEIAVLLRRTLGAIYQRRVYLRKRLPGWTQLGPNY